MAYRFGAFHALSDVAYRKLLPERVKPAQVRSALSAIINRQVNAPGTFNPEGWLRVGFAGYQPHIGETYISTGSLYLCTAVFIALGLPESDEFWSSPSADWTCKKGWAGVDLNVDKALKNRIKRRKFMKNILSILFVAVVLFSCSENKSVKNKLPSVIR